MNICIYAYIRAYTCHHMSIDCMNDLFICSYLDISTSRGLEAEAQSRGALSGDAGGSL